MDCKQSDKEGILVSSLFVNIPVLINKLIFIKGLSFFENI